jgi:hypothetical protein
MPCPQGVAAGPTEQSIATSLAVDHIRLSTSTQQVRPWASAKLVARGCTG